MHPEALPMQVERALRKHMLPDPCLVTCSFNPCQADDAASSNRDGVRSNACSRSSISANAQMMDEEQASKFALHAACREGQSKQPLGSQGKEEAVSLTNNM